MGEYFLAVGGTGNKILESAVYGCAADAFRGQDGRPLRMIDALIVDVDAACGNTTRAKQAAEHYESVRAAFEAAGVERRGFHTRLSVQRWSMDLARRAASVEAMTRNHRRDRLLADALFSQTEAALEYNEGFRGHPDLGVLFFADALQALDERAEGDELAAMLRRMRQDIDAGETVRVMLAGSVFGGTGASGIPALSRFLRERFGKDSERFVLSAALMLPYYRVPPADADEALEIVVKSSAFPDKAKTALQYYGMERLLRTGENDAHGVYDALYLLGLPQEAFVQTRLYSTGSQSQENDSHLMEWLAMRCAARFFATGFRGEDARSMDCYYYQWHSRDADWASFDDDASRYQTAYGGLMKAAAVFFGECYPTLKVCVRGDDRRRARAVPYYATYFHAARRFSPAQRAQLEKLIDALYRLLMFYVNYVTQVLRSLPPTMRRERADERAAAELAQAYADLTRVRLTLDDRDRLLDGASRENREALSARIDDRDATEQLHALMAQVRGMVAQVGGGAYLDMLTNERARVGEGFDAMQAELAELDERIALWQGADAHRADPLTVRQARQRRDALGRRLEQTARRLRLLHRDVERAIADNVVATIPAPNADTGVLPENGLFSAEGVERLHELLTLYGTPAEKRDAARFERVCVQVLEGLTTLVGSRVADAVDLTRVMSRMGSRRCRARTVEECFASFTAALLTDVWDG